MGLALWGHHSAHHRVTTTVQAEVMVAEDRSSGENSSQVLIEY